MSRASFSCAVQTCSGCSHWSCLPVHCREKDIDEVLQAATVFSNVSKGTLAKHEDLVDVFGTEDEDKICLIILAEGDLQVVYCLEAVLG